MINHTKITCPFLDIGGVLLTNGWDHIGRQQVAKHFGLDLEEMEHRHHLAFDTYEQGKLSLDSYLDTVVFYEERPFTREDFRRQMFALSQPYPTMIEMIKTLKAEHHLQLIVVSNEGRELNDHRISRFGLNTFIDAFISSSFVHLRKPDTEIFRLALDIAQVTPNEVLYIENTPMFVQVAAGLGIRGILHTDHNSTRAHLANFGLTSNFNPARPSG
jgi:putative hydrolase of the HAD superfamily